MLISFLILQYNPKHNFNPIIWDLYVKEELLTFTTRTQPSNNDPRCAAAIVRVDIVGQNCALKHIFVVNCENVWLVTIKYLWNTCIYMYIENIMDYKQIVLSLNLHLCLYKSAPKRYRKHSARGITWISKYSTQIHGMNLTNVILIMAKHPLVSQNLIWYKLAIKREQFHIHMGSSAFNENLK